MILSDVMFGLVSGGYSDWREQYDKEWERKKKNVRGGGDANSSSRNSSDAGGGGVNGTATALEDALFLMYDDANNSGGNGTIYATPPLPAAAPPSPFAPSSSSKDDADDDHHENNDLHINCQKTITWRSSLNGDCFTPKTASVIVALMLFAMSTRTSADVFVNYLRLAGVYDVPRRVCSSTKPRRRKCCRTETLLPRVVEARRRFVASPHFWARAARLFSCTTRSSRCLKRIRKAKTTCET